MDFVREDMKTFVSKINKLILSFAIEVVEM